jgi:hypothetical protein
LPQQGLDVRHAWFGIQPIFYGPEPIRVPVSSGFEFSDFSHTTPLFLGECQFRITGSLSNEETRKVW